MYIITGARSILQVEDKWQVHKSPRINSLVLHGQLSLNRPKFCKQGTANVRISEMTISSKIDHLIQ